MMDGRVAGRPERLSTLGVGLALLGFCVVPASPAFAEEAHAVHVAPVQDVTYELSPSQNPITFGRRTDIDAAKGDGVSDDRSDEKGTLSKFEWTIVNRGSILSEDGAGLRTGGITNLTNQGTIGGGEIGVSLPDGSRIANELGASIEGGAEILGLGTIRNSGAMSGSTLLYQGTFINRASGVVTLLGDPLEAFGSDVTNAGFISNDKGDGIYLGDGKRRKSVISAYNNPSRWGPGSLTNTATGRITADGGAGVVSFEGSNDLTNAGSIEGAFGVVLVRGGALVNAGQGTITGGKFGVGDFGDADGYASTIVNRAHASIWGDSAGISFGFNDGATTLTNEGAIGGGDVGVEIASGSITNLFGGAIEGGSTAIAADSDTTTVDNNGLILGDIFLSHGGTVINSGAGLLAGDIYGKGPIDVTNAGTWQIAGKGGYESGGGTITNLGTIELESFAFKALEKTRGGFAEIYGATVFRNGSHTATGVIDLANGYVGDTLRIGSPFVGAFGHSVLNLDAFLGGPGSQADQLELDGGSSGQTRIRIQNANPGHGTVNGDGIVLVTGATAAGDFVLDPTVGSYDKKTGGIVRGLYLYTLTFQKGDEVLIAGLAPAAHQLSTSLTVGQSILSSTDLSSSGGSSGGAGFVGFTGSADASLDRPRIWTAAVNTLAPDPMGQGRYAGRPGESQMAALPTLRLSSVQSSAGMDTGYDQGIAMLKGGVDLIRHQDGKTSFNFGVGTAYVQSDQRFTDGGAAMFYSGVVYGGYADYHSGPAYVTASFKSAMLKARYQAPWLTGQAPSAGLTATGIAIDGGTRFGLGHGWSLEPVASMAASRTSMSDLQIDGETARFNSSLTGWANVGARLEGSAFIGGYKIDSRFTARVWDRFGDNSAYLAGLGPDSPLVDRISGVSGEVAAELRVSAGANLHGFVQTSARAGMAQTSAAALAGLSLSW